MADRILCFSWGEPVRGREERAVEVFNEAVGFYGRLQQDGRIEEFDVVLLGPNRDLGGWFLLRGTAEQLFAVRESEDFQRLVVDAQLIVDDVSIQEGWTGAAIAPQMQLYSDAIAKVPQATA
jgi:hypothetical protein